MADLSQSMNPKEQAGQGVAETPEELKFQKPLTSAELDIIEKQIMPYLENNPAQALGWFSITSPEILESFTKDAFHKAELYLKPLGEEVRTLGSFMDVRLANNRAEIFREQAQEQEQKPIKPLPKAEANIVSLAKLPFRPIKKGYDRDYDIRKGRLRGSKKGGTDRLKLNESEIKTLLHELNHVAHNILEQIFVQRQSMDPDLTSPDTYDRFDANVYFKDFQNSPEPIKVVQTTKKFGSIGDSEDYRYGAFSRQLRPFANKTHETIYRLLSDRLFTEDLAFYNSEVVSQQKPMPFYFEQQFYNTAKKFPQLGMPRDKDDFLSTYTSQGGILPSDREYIRTLDMYNTVIQKASQSVLDDLNYTVKENIMQKKNMPTIKPPMSNDKESPVSNDKEDRWYIPNFIENMFSKNKTTSLDNQMKELKVD